MAQKIRLTDVPLFQYLEQDHVALLNECAVPIQKKSQEAIIMEGEDVLGIYVVSQSQVQVHSGNPHRPITLIQTGEAFGEMSLIENTHASATIRAATDDTRLIFIHGDRFREQMGKHPKLATAFYRGVATVLSKRLRLTTRQASEEITKKQKLNASISRTASSRPLSAQCRALQEKLVALAEFLRGHSDSAVNDLKKYTKHLPRTEQGDFTASVHHTEKVLKDCSGQVREVVTTTEHLEKLVQNVETYLFTL